jgi:hypothetical protein
MTGVVFVVEVFDVRHRSPAIVSRSREFALKRAERIWSKAGADTNSGVFKVKVWECKEYKYFSLIKIYK